MITQKLKDINSIFRTIASQPQYREVRKRYKVSKVLSKILLPQQLHYILYSFYRQNKLIIAVANHIGQSELNLQKMTLLKIFKQIKGYEDIHTVSIFRDPKFQLAKLEEPKTKIITFDERSYGIFENNITNENLSSQIEAIRKLIISKT